MAIEKDTTFKFVGKNFIKVLFDLVNMPETVDPYQLREETEELISLKISQLRPDFVGRAGNVIVMFEFESSYVGNPSKKRFHAYVALYDYELNDEDLDIIFCVITTKENSKIVEYKIGDIDNFKIAIFNIAELGFEEIINKSLDKIEKQEVFSAEELVKLALTSLMPLTREGIIDQFYKLSEMMDSIVFEDEDARISFAGILLLLSNIYFDINDGIRKKIQGVFMGKIDCIVELCDEKVEEGLLIAAKNFLISGLSAEFVSENTNLPLGKIKELEKEIKSSN
jgi:hypothetical protein